MVFYETHGKKELKWELTSDIGKYDNIYKLSFKTINDQGAEKGKSLPAFFFMFDFNIHGKMAKMQKMAHFNFFFQIFWSYFYDI